MWPDRQLQDLFKIEFPIVLAPMAGVMDADLVIAVAEGGGLGSLPCAMLSVDKAREQVNIIRQRVAAPVNVNFFCHTPVEADAGREATWSRGWRPIIGSWTSIRTPRSAPPTGRRSTLRCANWLRS